MWGLPWGLSLAGGWHTHHVVLEWSNRRAWYFISLPVISQCSALISRTVGILWGVRLLSHIKVLLLSRSGKGMSYSLRGKQRGNKPAFCWGDDKSQVWSLGKGELRCCPQGLKPIISRKKRSGHRALERLFSIQVDLEIWSGEWWSVGRGNSTRLPKALWSGNRAFWGEASCHFSHLIQVAFTFMPALDPALAPAKPPSSPCFFFFLEPVPFSCLHA